MPRIITDDGVGLHYEESGSGKALIFVHEFAGDWRSWEPQMRHFARRYRCISYSARGYAPSDVPGDWRSYSQARVSADIACVMDGLAIRQAHVVGLSMGAFATLHFGLRCAADSTGGAVSPEAPRALSLCLAGVGSGAHPADYRAFQASSRAYAQSIRAQGMAHFAATYGHGAVRVQYARKDPRGFAEAVAQLSEHSAEGSANTMRGYQSERPCLYELTDAIARISVPTLILSGDEDEPCLETSLMLKRTIPTAHLGILPGSGHAINLEEPALFNQMLENFLAQVDAGVDFARHPVARPSSIWGPDGDPRSRFGSMLDSA
ncbi:MAG: alpha/beta hydrolase [Betaproteobacteria bacterium]|nr:alpha/beta hydrolase [Betaproteobacteria bacterium]